MGDSRATVKIEFSIYGKNYKNEWWINWSSEDCGCDERIATWFENCRSEAYDDLQERNYEADREERERRVEATERAELARLEAKYGLPQGTPQK